MKKILLIVPSLNQGGIERQISFLAPRLVQRGYEVTVAVFYGGEYYESILRNCGVRIEVLTGGHLPAQANLLVKGIRWLERAAKIGRLAASRRYDVTYGFGIGANLLSVVAKGTGRCRVAWGVRNSLPSGTPLMRHVERIAARFADTIISNSFQGQKIYVGEGLPAAKFQIIPNGFDTTLYLSDPVTRREVRQEFGVSDNEILVGTVGRIDSNKDHASLVQAAQAVLKSVPNARFLIIGGGQPEEVAQVKGLIASLDLGAKVLVTSPRGDIHRCLNAMDIFVLSSITEGFPNVVAEAMSVGLPCVVTDAGDSALIVGPFGIVVPPSNPDSLAKGIIETIGMLSEVDRKAIRQHIVDNYAVESMVQRTESALQALLT